MHDIFISYIESQVAHRITDEESALIKKAFKPKKLKRNQFLLQEGDVCKYVGFIIRGAVKQFVVTEDGKEDILGLYLENWWAGDRESFAQGTPSPYYFQATEETEMLVATKEDLFPTISELEFMKELQRTLTERQSFHLLRRVHITKTLSAEQRLAELEKDYPQFLQRFPLHIIASYLGMTKETMSRIRSSSIKK